jgi:hypothetical protein
MLKVQRPSKQKDRLLQEVLETGESKKRLNAVVEAALYKRIKACAVEEDRSISDITRALWLEYLSK